MRPDSQWSLQVCVTSATKGEATIKGRQMRLVFWIGFWIFLLDQASKFYVVHMLELDRVTRIEVWPPFLNLHMAWNTGVCARRSKTSCVASKKGHCLTST